MKKILDKIKGLIGEQLLALLLTSVITEANILKGADVILDFLEDYAAKTETKFDDKLFKKLRDIFKIPD